MKKFIGYIKPEEALKDPKERYWTLFQSSLQGVLIADIEENTLIYANPALYRMFGYTEKELEEVGAHDIHPIEALEYVISEFKAHAREGKIVAQNIPCVRKDGTIIYTDIDTTDIILDGKVYTVGFFSDVTKYRQAIEGLYRRDLILNAVSLIAEKFLRSVSPDEKTINEALRRLGQAMNISRIYICKNHPGKEDNLLFSLIHEYVSPGTISGINLPDFQNVPYKESNVAPWEQELSQNKTITGYTRNLPENAPQKPIPYDMWSIAAVPIFVKEKWWGFIGFDEYERERKWSEAEVDALKTTGMILGALIEREQMEKALNKSEERSRALVENLPVGLYRNTPGPDGKFVMANPAIARMFGYESVKEFMRHNVAEYYIDPRERALFSDKLITQGKVTAEELKLKRKDGSFLWGAVTAKVVRDESDKIIYFDGMIEDITARKQAEEVIQNAYAELDQIFNAAVDGMCIIDKEGKVLRVNTTFCTLFDMDKDEVKDKPCKEILHHPLCDTNRCPLSHILKGGERFETEKEIECKSGLKIPFIVTTTALHDYNGELIGIVEDFKDITEHKKIEKELEKIQRLESLGVLAGGITHDFNNLLAAIIGNLSLLETYAKSGKNIFQVLEKTKKASYQAKHLAQQLITFAKGGQPITKTVSLARILQDITGFVLSGSQGKCELSVSDDLWAAQLDEGQINQAISNLIINADQAMRKGGIIHVSAENICIDEKDNLPLKPGKYVKISVHDQGTGIPKEHINKIFDPYFTTKSQGSGLGLSVTYSIIRNHKGYIKVESEEGTGTSFHIYLPASEESIFTVQDEYKERLHHGKGKILLMEDYKNLREMVEEMLDSLGYEVESAENGDEAIALFKKAKEADQPFDAAILDLTIPGGMGGKEAIQQLRQIDPKIKAIVSSGYYRDPIMSEYKEYGFDGIIRKPYVITDLSEMLYKVIRERENTLQ
ncbi:MAG: PAS domain S-box protein [bacterium]